MDLKLTIQVALQDTQSSFALLEIIRAFKESGGSQCKAYDTLESIWKDFGFDNDDGSTENCLRDHLEVAMEVVWGFCPTSKMIWSQSLSTH